MHHHFSFSVASTPAAADDSRHHRWHQISCGDLANLNLSDTSILLVQKVPANKIRCIIRDLARPRPAKEPADRECLPINES